MSTENRFAEGNPYQSPSTGEREVTALPIWYAWFHRAYWPVWWIGAAMVAASWLNLVEPTIGWIGFALTCAASLVSYILPYLYPVSPADYVILDSRIFKSRGDAYYNAIERFRNGATLMFDGVAFAFRPNHIVASSVLADTLPLTESSARELADHAQSVYERLQTECNEFALAVSNRSLRISIMSGAYENSSELCRVTDGRIEWFS